MAKVSVYRIKCLHGEEIETEPLVTDLSDIDDALSFAATWLLQNEFTQHFINWFLQKVSMDKTDHHEIKELSQHMVVRHYSKGGYSVYGLRIDVDRTEDQPPEPEPEEEEEEPV